MLKAAIFLLFVVTALTQPRVARGQVLLQDSLALVSIYDSLGGASWGNNAQWKVGTVSVWYGVTVVGSRVTGLDLSFNFLSGKLPAAIGDLTALETLILQGNALSGSIPIEIGTMTALTTLNFDNNSLDGSLPTEIGNLTSLTTLSIHNNLLTGNLPTQLGNLTSLQTLDLSINQITGSIPTELGSLSNLLTLELYSNLLNGSIPASLGSIGTLTTLDLSDNQLTGSIPPELGALTLLDDLTLSSNQLTGAIPPELGTLSSLLFLYLDDNQLSGAIPPEIGNLTTILELNLGFNQFSGAIPIELASLTAMTGISISDNQLTGTIPVEIGNLTALNYLFLENNNLSGNIPIELGNLINLLEMNLSGNSLSGPIPGELGNISTLETLSLTSNSLTGALPDGLSNAASLKHLYLGDNKLSGAVPASYSLLDSLIDVNLAHNYIDQLPDFTLDWPDLGSLALEGNQLQFGHIDPYGALSLGVFTYVPQKPFGPPNPKEIYLTSGEPATINFTPTGANLTFQWMKDSVNLAGQNSPTLTIPGFSAADSGTYILKVASSDFPGDTLYSASRTLLPVQQGLFNLDRQNIAFGDSLNATAYAQAWADIDLDGDDDLFVGMLLIGQPAVNNRLYENNGNGTFTQLVSAGDLSLDDSDPRSASWADINNDGYPDLFASNLAYSTGASTPAPIKVYVNNQNKTFTAITLPAVANLDNTEGGAWGDYDSDGFVDLAVWGSSNAAGVLTLFHNNGDLTFTEVPGAFGGLASNSLGVLSWVDVDDNGTLDLFYSTTGYRAYFQNNGDGTFTRNLTNLIVTEPINSSRGHNWADLNNDGAMDLIQLGQAGGQTKFFFNDGAGNFTVVDDQVATGFDISARAATTGDIDNDGDIDLVVLSAGIDPPIFLNDGTGNFTKVSAAGQSMFPLYIFGSTTLSDINNDGFLDFLHYSEQLDATNTFVEYNIPRVYTNNAASGNNWLKVKLQGQQSNRLGIGAVVDLQYASGTQRRDIMTTSGFGAQNGTGAHFGLGNATTVASVSVTWPSGIVDEILNPTINSTLTIVEGTLAPPAGIRAAALSENSIEVQWSITVPNPGEQIVVERADASTGPFVILDTLAEGTTQFVDSALAVNKKYFYRASRTNGGTSAGYSNVVGAATFSSGTADTWRVRKEFITPGRLTILDLKADASGNKYLVGNFSGTLAIDGDSIYSSGGNDGIILKLGPENNVLWKKAFGGVGTELAISVAIGADSAVYVGGY